MSNVSHTNRSVCVSALLSCFHCFSALEIQNIQRASFYDSVSGLHEPPGECIQPAGPPKQKAFKATGETVGVGAGWEAWEAGLVLGFLFVLLIGLHERPISRSVLLYFKASVCVNNLVATAYTSLLILRIARTVLHIKRCVPAFSTCAILIHTSWRIVRKCSAKWCLFCS